MDDKIDDVDVEILKQDLALTDEMAKYPQYRPEAWSIVYECMVDLMYRNERKIVKTGLPDLIIYIEQTVKDDWGSIACQVLKVFGLITTDDIKIMWDSYIKAGTIVGDDDEDIYESRKLLDCR